MTPPVFFYGLFMDVDLLRAKGLHPRLVGAARLPGYQIYVGDRATLVPKKCATSYGMLMTLGGAELKTLYSAEDVRDYRPETVKIIRLEDGVSQDSVCYNLPAGQLGGGGNPEYAKRLSAVVLELGFPPGYADEIALHGTA